MPEWQGHQLADRACANVGEELRAALEEWQDRRLTSEDAPSRLSTGFLDGNNPIVDIYELKVNCPFPDGKSDIVLLRRAVLAELILGSDEQRFIKDCSTPGQSSCLDLDALLQSLLSETENMCCGIRFTLWLSSWHQSAFDRNVMPKPQVRLEHMLSRMRVLQSAAATAAPTQLLPHLYISGAVPAQAHHVLHYLGITHVLNATEDIPEPPATAGFMCACHALFWGAAMVCGWWLLHGSAKGPQTLLSKLLLQTAAWGDLGGFQLACAVQYGADLPKLAWSFLSSISIESTVRIGRPCLSLMGALQH